MKEIFESLPKTTKHQLVLLDTCFLIDTFAKHNEEQLTALCEEHDVAITSFNVEELVHVLPKVKPTDVKNHIRSYFKKKPKISVLEISVSPGNADMEKAYVAKVDPFLAQDIPDPSDAVLIAAAIETQSIVLTKDKHHLFTALLENYMQRWGLRVLKDMHEL
ncbi:MAG: PIN domain-containing protein [Bdellovibrionales bacterium]|nr:PIN domain-containing protein [Bdellovibrionales bacterium]